MSVCNFIPTDGTIPYSIPDFKFHLNLIFQKVHLPRKQWLINQDRHQHVTSKGMDSYRYVIGHMEVRPDR